LGSVWPVRCAESGDGPQAAFVELGVLVHRFGAEQVMVELIDHHMPEDSIRNDVLAEIAAALGAATVATNAVHYATPKLGRLVEEQGLTLWG
jgi:error-prone DNA polymerase